MMRPLQWLDEQVVLAIHEEQLAEHGGPTGVRDAGLLASALARPAQKFAYQDPDMPVDLAALAACYAWGLARNHPFVDGNKRTAFVAAELFLALQGQQLIATDAACVETFLKLAAGDMTETDLASWIRNHLR